MIEDEMVQVKVVYTIVALVLPPVEGEGQGQGLVVELEAGMCLKGMVSYSDVLWTFNNVPPIFLGP